MQSRTTRRSVQCGCAAGIVLVGVACGAEPASPIRIDGASPDVVLTGVSAGWLSGAVGPIVGINAAATALSSYDDGRSLSVAGAVDLGDRAVMLLVLATTEGGTLFTPGTHASFLSDSDSRPTLTVLGCVGETIGNYGIYDAPADEVDLDVDPLDDILDAGAPMHVSVTARWMTGAAALKTDPAQVQVASLEFDLSR